MTQDVLQDALVSGQRPNERGARNQEDAHAQEADDRDIFTIDSQASISTILTGGQQVNAANDDTMTRAMTHWGTPGNQPTKNVAAPVTSRPDTMMSMTQYSHPMVNPAHRPIPASA